MIFLYLPFGLDQDRRAVVLWPLVEASSSVEKARLGPDVDSNHVVSSPGPAPVGLRSTGAGLAEPNPVEQNSAGVAPAEMASIVENVLPAVVTIRATAMRQNYDQNYFLYGDQSEETEDGSGFFISDNGFILTSSHIVDHSDGIVVKFGGREIPAELIGQDRILDIALLKVNVGARKLRFLELRPDVPSRVGDPVLIIGNPYGLGLSVSSGIISALNRTVLDSDFSYSYLQIDAAMRPGNSGGPVFNGKGEVIGISTFERSSANGKVGIGFALPIDGYVLDVIEKLKKFGYRQNGYIGLSGVTIDRSDSDYLKILSFRGKTGVLVTQINKDSPAAKGGLMLNDIVISYDGNRVSDLNALLNMIVNTTVGSRVELLTFRNGKYVKLKIQIEESPRDTKDTAINQVIRNNSLEILDMFISQVCEELVEKYELYSGQAGLYVLDVKKGGWAEMNGIERGDILLTVNQTQIRTKKDLLQFFDNMKLNGQREFVMLFRKQRNKSNVLVKSNINLLGR
ncbi:MAG: trypsin-like peptidase domain-containing protein [Rickettsiales bacterium]|nr:trypsin-like peptidase domain-containing protein [Rickettsiales bacterium]